MTEQEESAYHTGYQTGQQATARGVLRVALNMMEREGPEWERANWEMERSETIAALRMLCRDHDLPNGWDDDLHLADIINKYVARGLE